MSDIERTFSTQAEAVFDAFDLPYHAKAVEIVEQIKANLSAAPLASEIPELVSAIAKALEEAVREARLQEREECANYLMDQAKALVERADSGTTVKAELFHMARFVESLSSDFRATAIRSRED